MTQDYIINHTVKHPSQWSQSLFSANQWLLFTNPSYTDLTPGVASARQSQAGRNIYTFMTIMWPQDQFSSRFTSSAKYEMYFPACFQLAEERTGQVCNACVLIVKRWRNLPEDTGKHWAHVVDARIGPGVKTVQRPRDQNPVIFHKIKKKVPHKKVRPEKEAQTKTEIKTPDIPDFLDSSYWTR